MARIVAAATLLVALALPPAARAAAERGPSTPEERKRAVQTTRKLEKEPLARSSAEDRAWLFQWIVEIPDINVMSCSGPLDPLLKADEDSSYARLLYVQSVFGMAAFLVEHPKKKDDWVSIQTAGIESVLRAYESILRADSGARWKPLDRLLKVRKDGKLRSLVQKEMAECGKPEGEKMGPAPRDAI